MRAIENFRGLHQDVRIAEIRLALVGRKLFETSRTAACGNSGRWSALSPQAARRARQQLVRTARLAKQLRKNFRNFKNSAVFERADVAAKLRERGRLQELLHAANDFAEISQHDANSFFLHPLGVI